MWLDTSVEKSDTGRSRHETCLAAPAPGVLLRITMVHVRRALRTVSKVESILKEHQP